MNVGARRRLTRTSMALAVLLASLGVAAAPQPALAQDGSIGYSVCPDLQRGAEIDIVVLMDVSLSLVRGPSGSSGSDPNGIRFSAVDELISGLAVRSDDSQPNRNVAFINFGGTPQIIIPFGAPLDLSNEGSVRAQIRRDSDPNRLPIGQTKYTDYIQAVNEASALFQTRPAQNCRVLVWFTDGVHDPNDDSLAAADQPEADELLAEFCGPDGIVARVRAQNVAPFVLFLEPSSIPASFTQRLGASLAVMRAVTGDPSPRLGRYADDGPVCTVPSTRQVGEVLPASDAERLVGLLTDLPNAIDGGRPAAPETCPYSGGPVGSYPLPDARLIDWLSLASYDLSRPVELADIAVLDAAGTVVPQALEQLPDGSAGSIRVRVRSEVRDRLTPGWRIEIEDAADRCLRLKPAALTFEVSGRPSVRPIAPPDLPPTLYEGRLQLESRDGSTIELQAGTVIPAGVRGRLRIEFGAPFVDGGVLPVTIVVVGAPTIGCGFLQLPDPATLTTTLGRATVPEGLLVSSVCDIGLAGVVGQVTIDATDALASLAASCPSDSRWRVVGSYGSEERALDPIVRLAVGDGLTGLRLQSVSQLPNVAIDCRGLTIAPIELEWQGSVTPIPLSFDVALEARPNVRATIVATIVGTLLAAFFSLVLLRVLNGLWIRPPADSTLRGYEFDASLITPSTGSARIVLPNGNFSFDQDSWRSVASSDVGRLSSGSVRLQRRLPSVLSPWRQPILEVKTQPHAEFIEVEPAVARGDEMPCGFRDAVIVSALSSRRPEDDRPVPVRVSILLPRTGAYSGRSHVEHLVRERLPGLARRLADRLATEAATVGRPDSTGNATMGPAPSGPRGPGPDGPPTRPKTGRPVGPPTGPTGGETRPGPPSGGSSAGPSDGSPSETTEPPLGGSGATPRRPPSGPPRPPSSSTSNH